MVAFSSMSSDCTSKISFILQPIEKRVHSLASIFQKRRLEGLKILCGLRACSRRCWESHIVMLRFKIPLQNIYCVKSLVANWCACKVIVWGSFLIIELNYWCDHNLMTLLGGDGRMRWGGVVESESWWNDLDYDQAVSGPAFLLLWLSLFLCFLPPMRWAALFHTVLHAVCFASTLPQAHGHGTNQLWTEIMHQNKISPS